MYIPPEMITFSKITGIITIVVRIVRQGAAYFFIGFCDFIGSDNVILV